MGVCILVGKFAGEEDEGQEWPLVQAGSPGAMAVQWVGDSAVNVSAVVTGVEVFGLDLEWLFLVGGQNVDRQPAVVALSSRLKLEVVHGGG